jgi:MoaA/NifB/PqqE/SkfB family radical SAM enzyme
MSRWHVNPRILLDRRRRVELVMDVVGVCNLKCPSCPVGSMGYLGGPKGFVDRKLFAQVIEKAVAEYNVYRVTLYNWAEPLLNPELPDLIRLVKSHDLYCELSSNLNILRNPEELFKANPDSLRISVSGFTQPIYEQGHRGGNIERVKENMRLLMDARQRVGNLHTQVHVFYHKYRYNLHEAPLMRQYAQSLGIVWSELWAYLMPLEKAADAMEGKLSREEEAYMKSKFALPVLPAIEAARKYNHHPCRNWEEQIVLDLQGNATLCCNLYDMQSNSLGSFLDLTPEQLWQKKSNHPTFERCIRHGVFVYHGFYLYPELNALYNDMAARNLQSPSPTTDPS